MYLGSGLKESCAKLKTFLFLWNKSVELQYGFAECVGIGYT